MSSVFPSLALMNEVLQMAISVLDCFLQPVMSGKHSDLADDDDAWTPPADCL